MSISDPILDACRRAGERFGKVAFRDFGADATEENLFALERIFIHGPSDLFMDSLGASDDQRLLAKIISGHALRSRYENLVRSAAAARFNSGFPRDTGRPPSRRLVGGQPVAGTEIKGGTNDSY